MHGRQDEDAMVSSVIMQNHVTNFFELVVPILIEILAQVSGAAAVVIQLFAATSMRYLS